LEVRPEEEGLDDPIALQPLSVEAAAAVSSHDLVFDLKVC
jgi:hypothetical protein